MKTETENFNPQQSLDLIAAMILEAKGNVQRNSFFFLLWGWVVVVANIGMYLLAMFGYPHPYVTWAITIPAWIYTLAKVYNRKKSPETATHFDRISGALWICFGVSIAILVAFGARMNYQLNPLILTITAIPTFVSGMILRFKPFMIGGVSFWFFGIACFLIPMEFHPLVGAAAIILGYLIPGYLLKAKDKNQYVQGS